MWYEWIVEVFASTSPEPIVPFPPIPSQGKGKEKEKGKLRARKTRIAVSELHSSFKEACLM